MGFVYHRPDSIKLWLSYNDASGTRRRASTPYVIGDEPKAEKMLAALERRIDAEKRAMEPGQPAGPLTLKTYGERWLKERPAKGIATSKDETSRMRLHVWPVLGDVLLKELRPRHIRDLVQALRTKKSERGTTLAPRTVRHCYGTLHTMLHDAVVDELIETNPCVLKRGELPGKVDRDPTWRAKAIYSREEVEQIISDERIPEDRRTLYTLLFVAGLRFGEASALTWSAYDAGAEPLGRLEIAASYDTKTRKVGSTKTERPRPVPVHPTLAKVLAAWKLAGWQRMFGRAPRAEDMIVPSRKLAHRNANHGLRKFHEDLERLGLRPRRQHDLRRTFISLALADGARKDILRWVTHGPEGDIIDLYTTLPWPTLCDEVGKLRIELLAGRVLAMPVRAAVGARSPGEEAQSLSRSLSRSDVGQEKSPQVRGLGGSFDCGVDGTRTRENDRARKRAASQTPEIIGPRAEADERGRVAQSEDRDNVTNALVTALSAWKSGGNREDLRSRLERLLEMLGGQR